MSVFWPIKSLLLLFWSKSALEVWRVAFGHPLVNELFWRFKTLRIATQKIFEHFTEHLEPVKIGSDLEGLCHILMPRSCYIIPTQFYIGQEQKWASFFLPCPVLTHECFTTPKGSSFGCDHFSGSDHYDHITSHLAGLFLYCSAVYSYMHGKANKMLPVKLGGTVKESRKPVWYISLWLPLSVYSLDFSAGMFWFDDITHVLKDCKKPSSDLNFTNLPLFRKLSWKKILIEGLNGAQNGQSWTIMDKCNKTEYHLELREV